MCIAKFHKIIGFTHHDHVQIPNRIPLLSISLPEPDHPRRRQPLPPHLTSPANQAPPPQLAGDAPPPPTQPFPPPNASLTSRPPLEQTLAAALTGSTSIRRCSSLHERHKETHLLLLPIASDGGPGGDGGRGGAGFRKVIRLLIPDRWCSSPTGRATGALYPSAATSSLPRREASILAGFRRPVVATTASPLTGTARRGRGRPRTRGGVDADRPVMRRLAHGCRRS